MKTEPSVGLLVCKRPLYGEIRCRDAVRNEKNNLLKLKNEYELNTVEVYTKLIQNVTCATGDVNRRVCTGLLRCWIGKEEGRFEQVRDHIVQGK